MIVDYLDFWLNIEAFNSDYYSFLFTHAINDTLSSFPVLVSKPTSQVKKIRKKDDVCLPDHSVKPV